MNQICLLRPFPFPPTVPLAFRRDSRTHVTPAGPNSMALPSNGGDPQPGNGPWGVGEGRAPTGLTQRASPTSSKVNGARKQCPEREGAPENKTKQKL